MNHKNQLTTFVFFKTDNIKISLAVSILALFEAVLNKKRILWYKFVFFLKFFLVRREK